MIIQDRTHGFPAGYFLIRSVATNRLLDVANDDVRDGAELILWPEKENSIVEGFRNQAADNQVYYIDATGALCSKQSGHAIDIQGRTLVIRHRQPIGSPHDQLPNFTYDATTELITATVLRPSAQSSSSSSQSQNNPWSSTPPYEKALHSEPTPGRQMASETYILHSVPQRQPRSLMDNATSFLKSSFLGGAAQQATPEEIFDGGEIDLREGEVEDDERGEEGELDDSTELGRKVKVSPFHGGVNTLVEQAKLRRRWKVIPLRKANARWHA